MLVEQLHLCLVREVPKVVDEVVHTRWSQPLITSEMLKNKKYTANDTEME